MLGSQAKCKRYVGVNWLKSSKMGSVLQNRELHKRKNQTSENHEVFETIYIVCSLRFLWFLNPYKST